MANNSNNCFFPIFEQDEEPSTPPTNGRKTPPKRARHETPRPPQAQLAIEATPRGDTAITNRLDEIELTVRRYPIRLDTVDKRLLHLDNRCDVTEVNLDSMMDHWIQIDRGLDTVSKKVDVMSHLDNAPLDRPAPVAAHAAVATSDPGLVEAIATLSKKVDDLLARPAPAPLPLLPLIRVRTLPLSPRRSMAFLSAPLLPRPLSRRT
jgi:hypothetical protein